ncbi:hypothetical protein B0H67DRAFT_496985 [Lasiosphaeris hirsuta]|uniref:Uncharacterized protein n=1 Tax=Lasiosphaeris hirsuta TaxID=260670 RepID=A0AA40DMA8_9PEZI|nr:hypothetical protein B0H67DRAFT_496985 [Lasiosphaeris hirsuta]
MDVTVNGPFSPVYQQGQPGSGIGGFNLGSARDLSFAFDYASTGKLDHMVLYRPGTGTVWILRNAAGAFSPVYAEGDPGSGIGGYNLRSAGDRGLAFDYDSTGKLDHMVFYRPGTGTIWILRNDRNGTFTPVYAQGDPGTGIGGFDLSSVEDRIFAFDYDHSGKQDHLAIYRPGAGTIWILRNDRNGAFTPVYAEGDPGKGIGGFNLRSKRDRAFAFDYGGGGKMDHIALYRPGTGTFWVVRNNGGVFRAVFSVGDPGIGIAGFNLKSVSDVAFAYDWTHSGRSDHVAFYRPGTGTFWVVARDGGGWRAVHAEGDPGAGVGGFDMKSEQDKMYAFDYKGSGLADHLVVYRTNATGTIWILKHV